MKPLLTAALALLTLTIPAKAPELAAAAEPRLSSRVHSWKGLPVEKRPNGVRRQVLDGPTTALDRLHAHATTLDPGQVSGEPRLHPQEELIIVQQGTIEAHFDGHTQIADAGSVIFFAANAVTFLKNAGSVPATYHVVYYQVPGAKPVEAGKQVPR
jgi:quercetin dioxygenase-like cupin family protein